MDPGPSVLGLAADAAADTRRSAAEAQIDTTKAPDHRSGAFVLVVLDHSTEPSTVVLKMFLLFSSKM